MSVLLVIPARYASTRYPGKPLVELEGASGQKKSLIQRSWEAGVSVKGVDRVVVATDDARIKEACEAFGAEVVMTATSCRNGTERCAEALENVAEAYDLVVNLQGDAPLTPHWFVEDLIQAMNDDPSAAMATPVLRCDGRALNGFLEDRKAGRVGGTTVVFDKNRHALFFSKEVIPYTTRTYNNDEETPVFHHVGAYAYRPQALKDYLSWEECEFEKLEGLEQLRFLENGAKVHCVEVEARGRQFWELNNPEDVPRLQEMMSEMGIE